MSKFIPLCTAFALGAACAHDGAPAQAAHERNWEQGLDSEHAPQIAPLGPLENDQFAYDFIRRREREHALGTKSTASDLDEIIGNFAVLDDWDDRYRYLIELGRELPPLAEAAHSDANKVQGCASQVWLDTTVRPNGAGGPVLIFAGDSDAYIVRGLIAILFAVYSGKSAREILNTDAVKLFEGMGLREHLTPQRSNGFRSMVERIRSDARAALPAAA